MKRLHLPVGITDFSQIRRWQLERGLPNIVDKTGFLPELLAQRESVTVFTGPPGFRKSSNLSMMERFLSNQDAENNRLLFDGLAINDEKYAEFREYYQGKFPVIRLSLKDIQASTWDGAQEEFCRIMAGVYKEHSYVQPSLYPRGQEVYQSIIDNAPEPGDLNSSLYNLTSYLEEHHKQKSIVMIDDYDVPLRHAYQHTKKEDLKDRDSYFQLMFSFLGGFFGYALKGNSHVKKGFMAGTLHVSFTHDFLASFNNAIFHSVLGNDFAEAFCFTKREVGALIGQVEGITDPAQLQCRLQQHCGGYYKKTSLEHVYNPLLVAQFLGDLSITRNDYLVEVADNISLSERFNTDFKRIRSKLTDLLLGKKVEIEIYEYTALSDLNGFHAVDDFFGLLLHLGYLSICKVHSRRFTMSCDVAIPNYSAVKAYIRLLRCYEASLTPGDDEYSDMLRDLRVGSLDELDARLQSNMEQSLSFHAVPDQPHKLVRRSSLEREESAGPSFSVLGAGQPHFFPPSTNSSAAAEGGEPQLKAPTTSSDSSSSTYKK